MPLASLSKPVAIQQFHRTTYKAGRDGGKWLLRVGTYGVIRGYPLPATEYSMFYQGVLSFISDLT